MIAKIRQHQRNILIVVGVLVIGVGWTVRDVARNDYRRRRGNLTMTVGAGILVAGFLSAKPRKEEDEPKNPSKEP